MAKKEHSRFKRYLDIILLSLLSLALSLLIVPVASPLGLYLANTWATAFNSPWCTWTLIFSFSVISALLSIPLAKIGALNWRHLKLFHRYPPFWSAAAIAISLTFSFWLFIPFIHGVPIGIFEWISATMILLFGLITGMTIGSLQHKPSNINAEPENQSTTKNKISNLNTEFDILNKSPRQVLTYLTENPDTLTNWLSQEAPIDNPQHDLFNNCHIAKQLANTISDNPEGTFGLIGGFGSGKTSILNLVNHYIDNNTSPNKYIRVFVDQWGRSDSPAISHALKTAINELSNHVDCLSIASLPERYIATLDKSNPPWWLHFLFIIFPPNRSTDPVEQLQRLNNVLEAIDKHLILYIEDIDRNEHDPNALRKQYARFQLMLDQLRLRKCNHLTFVLTAASAAFDFSRLCEHRFSIPTLNPNLVGAIVQSLRYNTLNKSVNIDNDIDPAKTPENISKLSHQLPKIESWRLRIENEPIDRSLPLDDICQLLSQPRRLKEVLRSTNRIWKMLHGEVDFDDLLLCRIIRLTSERAFSFIYDYISILHDWHLDIGSDDGEKRKNAYKKIEKLWEERIDDCATSEKPLLFKIIKYLFSKNTFSPQSIRHDRQNQGYIYWRRVWEERIDDFQQPRDQIVLHAIQDWKQDHSTNLPQKLDDVKGFADVFEHFQSTKFTQNDLRHELRLDNKDLLDLSEQIINNLMTNLGADASRQDSNGFITCWRTIIENGGISDKNKYWDWILKQIDNALPISLLLALDIELYWGNVKYSYLSVEKRIELRKLMFSNVKSTWSDAPNSLAESLSIASKHNCWALNNFVQRAYDTESDPFQPKDWQWLLPVLHKGLFDKPEKIVPHVIVLLGKDIFLFEQDEFGTPVTIPDVEINHQFVCDFIPNQEPRAAFIKAVIDAANNVQHDNWPDDVTSLVDEMLTKLKTWLDQDVPCIPPE